MSTTASLQPGGRSVQIQCDACGAPLRISLLRQDGRSGLSPVTGRPQSKGNFRVQAAQRLLIASALTGPALALV